MADQVMKTGDEIEVEIAEKLKPFAPHPFPPRPRIEPVATQRDFHETESSIAREARLGLEQRNPAEPVKTVVQSLSDIESMIEQTRDQVFRKLDEQNQNLAKIIKAVDERLARIENSIGVR